MSSPDKLNSAIRILRSIVSLREESFSIFEYTTLILECLASYISIHNDSESKTNEEKVYMSIEYISDILHFMKKDCSTYPDGTPFDGED